MDAIIDSWFHISGLMSRNTAPAALSTPAPNTGPGLHVTVFMHFWLAFCYFCCLFSVRYRCIWGRCGRCSQCGVSWHPERIISFIVKIFLFNFIGIDCLYKMLYMNMIIIFTVHTHPWTIKNWYLIVCWRTVLSSVAKYCSSCSDFFGRRSNPQKTAHTTRVTKHRSNYQRTGHRDGMVGTAFVSKSCYNVQSCSMDADVNLNYKPYVLSM